MRILLGCAIAFMEPNHVIAGIFSDPLVKMLPQGQSHLCVLSVCWALLDPWICMGWEQSPTRDGTNPINIASNLSALFFPWKALKFPQEKLHLKLAKLLFLFPRWGQVRNSLILNKKTKRVTEHRNGLLRDVVESPSLETSKSHLETILGTQVPGRWDWTTPSAPSNLNHSRILWRNGFEPSYFWAF